MEPEPELISGEEKKEEQKSERFIATTSSYKRKKLKTCFQLKRSALIILDSSAVEQKGQYFADAKPPNGVRASSRYALLTSGLRLTSG